jgi:hypothetical protein
MVAVFQLAITLRAAVGGLLSDAWGYQATFAASAGILILSGLISRLASQQANAVNGDQRPKGRPPPSNRRIDATCLQPSRLGHPRALFRTGVLAAAALALVGTQPAWVQTDTASPTGTAMQLTQDGDETFAKSDRVNHQKLTFKSR